MTEIIYALCVVVAWTAAGKFLARGIRNNPGTILGSVKSATELLRNLLLCLAMMLIGIVCIKEQVQFSSNALAIFITMVGGAIGFITACAVVLLKRSPQKNE